VFLIGKGYTNGWRGNDNHNITRGFRGDQHRLLSRIVLVPLSLGLSSVALPRSTLTHSGGRYGESFDDVPGKNDELTLLLVYFYHL